MFLFVQVVDAQTVRSSPPIQITSYSIDVTLNPAHHSMNARATVTFTALENLTAVSFQLNPALRVRDIADASGQSFRFAGDRTIRVSPDVPLKQGDSVTWTFRYGGVFEGKSKTGDDPNPAEEVQLASIGDPISYLLYAARWFPTAGDMTDRFTATMHVHVPVGERVLGSGASGSPHLDKSGLTVFDFNWPQPGFPGTIIVGRFHEAGASDSSANVRLYLVDEKGGLTPTDAEKYAVMASREYSYFTSRFGSAGSGPLNIVELQDDTVPAYWAPGIAAVAGRQMQGENSSRLLANTIAHQWWGNEVRPATRNDSWITNGLCRNSELEYLKQNSDATTFADAVLNVSASALAYDTAPLADVSRYSDFSTEFQAMTYDKGAMIFRMLQWQIGDAAFQQTLHAMLALHDESMNAAGVEKIAEAASHQDLRPFFTQWLDSTGAPTLQDNWTLYRLGDNKGYRTVVEITQDLDLFRMPVEVRVEADGKIVTQRVDVAGPQTQFTIETFGVPRNISLDPERRLLRSDADMQVRVHILRGQNMEAANDSAGAIQEYRLALGIDSISSLASYRLGEVYFRQSNYQAAADAFRAALRGDGVPKWTEVWSDLELGKTFDASGQRDRAVNQYREALQTGDNTGGALDLARGYLEHGYQAMP